MAIISNSEDPVMLNAVIATGAGDSFELKKGKKTFQLVGSTSSGSGAVSCKVQVSNDGTNWLDLGTISLTLGVSATSDGFSSEAEWRYHRGNVTSISGTGATVSLYGGN